MREVLGEIDALDVPEQLVFNKIDAATPETLLRLRALDRTRCSCRRAPGSGLDELRASHRRAAAAPGDRLTALVPYTAG